ncbi:hypothetical protein [Rhodococcoides corynebacterioides]|uniref:Prevent-host-death family protein n=1 Tax=Rhodococcoides corynebacterioides TaxID=53972 RepID=A0ABS7NYM7_9NOCA|nr:hypothetical protein [Rhodococcus corynebacterioides]MBY6365248.1 hypothetical protein [Rhodococcus corynebacterioides]MBY6406660.1 hypothetical protein [Rhodococcus corynebacterioides]
MAAQEVMFSDLQLRGKAVAEQLRSTPGQSLVVRRRDSDDLVLTTVERAAQEREVVSVTTRMFVALMQRDGAARELVTDVLPDAFPWVSFLPRADVQAFVVDLVATLRSAESVANPAPVVRVIESWRNTAAVFADPALAEALAAPTDGDFGAVPAPDAR